MPVTFDTSTIQTLIGEDADVLHTTSKRDWQRLLSVVAMPCPHAVGTAPASTKAENFIEQTRQGT